MTVVRQLPYRGWRLRVAVFWLRVAPLWCLLVGHRVEPYHHLLPGVAWCARCRRDQS